jgi:hypothetical protein
MFGVLLAAALAQLGPIALTDGGALGLDDLGVTADGRFLILEAELGTVLLLAPDGGASRLQLPGRGGRQIGSAVLSGGLLIAGDRNHRELLVSGEDELVAFPLDASPDYVRVAGDQIWVTEPAKGQIEILGFTTKPLTVRALTSIPVAGGPVALALDPDHASAYTFSERRDRLVRFDFNKHVQTAEWPLACRGAPKGLATSFVDELAFVGCSEGLILTLSLRDGHQISRLSTGDGVDIIAFDPQRRRLYVPAGKSANLTIASVASDGSLRKLRTVPTVQRAHCVAAQGGIVLVCDPTHGRMLRVSDP